MWGWGQAQAESPHGATGEPNLVGPMAGLGRAVGSRSALPWPCRNEMESLALGKVGGFLASFSALNAQSRTQLPAPGYFRNQLVITQLLEAHTSVSYRIRN